MQYASSPLHVEETHLEERTTWLLLGALSSGVSQVTHYVIENKRSLSSETKRWWGCSGGGAYSSRRPENNGCQYGRGVSTRLII